MGKPLLMMKARHRVPALVARPTTSCLLNVGRDDGCFQGLAPTQPATDEIEVAEMLLQSCFGDLELVEFVLGRTSDQLQDVARELAESGCTLTLVQLDSLREALRDHLGGIQRANGQAWACYVQTPHGDHPVSYCVLWWSVDGWYVDIVPIESQYGVEANVVFLVPNRNRSS